MDLKVGNENASPNYFKKSCQFLTKFFFNNKSKKIYVIIFLIGFLLLGFLLGLIASGYFGTFDQPSGRAYALLTSIGIENSHDLKILAQGIIKQNIKIPLNYFKGKFSNPEKLAIEIGFNDLQRIEYKRQEAIEKGGLVSSREDYVPAKITHDGKTYRVKLRLKGDLPDHWSSDKWSFRIKVRDDKKIMGMKVFSIQNPKTRQEMNEWLYHKTLKKEGIIGLRYSFIEISINGENKGIYALEEHFSKELIESNERREGLIFKFNEDIAFQKNLERSSLDAELIMEFYGAQVSTFENENKILNDTTKTIQFEKGLNLLDNFRKGKLKAHEVFDKELWGKYYAIGTLMNCPHGQAWHNERFYYNPITSLMEPIGFDSNCRLDGAQTALLDYGPSCVTTENNSVCPLTPKPLSEMILRDKFIYEEYIKALKIYSNITYLDELFVTISPELRQNLNYLHKEKPFYHFPIEAVYRSRQQVEDYLMPIKSTNSYLEKIDFDNSSIILSIGNTDILPLELIKVEINNFSFYPEKKYLIQPRNLNKFPQYQNYDFKTTEKVNWDKDSTELILYYKIYGTNKIFTDEISPFKNLKSDFLKIDFIRKESNINDFPKLKINLKTKELLLEKGNYTFNESLILPKGYSLIVEAGTNINLINEAMILSYSPIFFEGTNKNKIKIYSTDKTGQGLTVLNAKEESLIQYTIFDGLKNPNKEGWELTSRINFYESDVKIENSFFLDSITEDSLNIIRSKFELNNVTFNKCFSDCFDGDFVKGIVKNSVFENCENDCLDFSGSEVLIEKTSIFNVGDKGISAGEKSIIHTKEITISGNIFIGFASKDESILTINDSIVNNAIYGIVAYQKKAEYGPSKIITTNVELNKCETSSLIEKESTLILNNNLVLTTEKGVYEKLYGNKNI